MTISKRAALFLFMAATFFVLSSCSTRPKMDLNKAVIIPKPRFVEPTGSSFELSEKSKLLVVNDHQEIMKSAQFLAELLRTATGFGLEIKSGKAEDGDGNIILVLEDDQELGKEGYELVINEKAVNLKANTTAGLVYGIQSLRQLFPDKIEKNTHQEGPWLLPTGTIKDYPEYAFRGAMLDVSRHFLDSDIVKKYIDYLSFYKYNVLHLHLSDDQGWRIEIKSWPKLTEIGGTTEVGGGKSGFFTQEDYKSIVEYAGERNITIIPEIDMPGHTNAALASYAKLNCNGKAKKLYTGIEVGFSTLCTDKELTYQFIDDVVRELAEMTPGPYIHIGGDESLVTEKEDYIYFINRVLKIVESHGKKVIGWEEIAQADIGENVVVQHWANTAHPVEAVEKGSMVLMSPAKKTYLDMKYDSTTALGLSWAGYIEVDTGYIWDPATQLEGVRREHIIGIEAPLWSETITNLQELEYMVFPRVVGIGEIGWTPNSQRDWEDFKSRMARHGKRLEAKQINFYRSPKIPWTE